MKKVKSWLLEDWWLKLLSFALAFILWFFVVQTTNPTSERSFSNIRVTLKNAELLDNDNKVYEIIDGTDIARVVVTAPKSVLTNLSASDISAVADVANMKDGVIPIEYDIVTNGNGSAESVKGSQDVLKISVEDRVRKYISVVNYTKGEVADGYMFNGVKLDQNMIEISGPASSVEAVEYAAVSINIDEANSSISALMDVKLYDSSNVEIVDSKITKQVEQIGINVEILQLKKVPIFATKMGLPASGYLYGGDMIIAPVNVTIAGNSDDLGKIAQIVLTEPVDVSDATEDVVAVYDLHDYLPEGIILADDDFDGVIKVTVKVEAASKDTYTLSVDEIELKNLPDTDKYVVNVSSIVDSVKVEIKGLRSALDELDRNDIGAYVDIDKWMENSGMTKLEEGKYSVPVSFTLPENIYGPDDIYVTIIVTEKK